MTGQPPKKKLSKGAKVGIVAGVGVGALLFLRGRGQGDGAQAGEDPLTSEGGIGPLNNTDNGPSTPPVAPPTAPPPTKAGSYPCSLVGAGWTGPGNDPTFASCSPPPNNSQGPTGPPGPSGTSPEPTFLEKTGSLVTDPINLLILGTTVGPLAYKGLKKGYEISRGGKKGSPERAVADEARAQRRSSKQEPAENLAGRRTETIEEVPGVKPKVQARDTFARSNRSVVNEPLPGALGTPRGRIGATTRDVIQQARGNPEQRGFTRGTLATGAALEGLNAITALPSAIDASRRLQASGYSNLAASGLATASAFGGFQASQENIDYARAHPVAAVAKLSAEDAFTLAQGGLNNNANEVRYAQTHGFVPAVGHAIGTEVVGIGTGLYEGGGYLAQGVANAGGGLWHFLWG